MAQGNASVCDPLAEGKGQNLKQGDLFLQIKKTSEQSIAVIEYIPLYIMKASSAAKTKPFLFTENI